PSVVHFEKLQPLRVDGRTTIIDNWITLAGGRNGAAELEGNQKEISIEQLLIWDPDVIIVGATVPEVEQLKADPRWAKLKAVQNGRIYVNPKGVFPWDRYGPEETLQVQWAAKTLHPDLFKDVDVEAELKAFYKTFFRYDLTDDDVRSIMAPPA